MLAVLGAAVLFGTTGTAQELGPDSSTPWSVGTLRIVVGSVALWALAGTLPRWSAVPGPARRAVLLGALGVAAYQPGFFIGTERSGVALGTMIALGSGPVFAGLITWILDRRLPGRWWWISTVVMAVGASVIVTSGDTGSDTVNSVVLPAAGVDVLGIVASLTAGAGYALYAVMTRRAIVAGLGSTQALAWQFTIGAIVLAPGLISPMTGVPLGWVASVSGLAMLAHLGVLTVGVAYLLYGIGLRVLEPATAVSITLAEPLTATVVAVVVLGERLGGLGLIGAALVIAGLGLLARDQTV
jgi:DME family drug/metabolite transporter